MHKNMNEKWDEESLLNECQKEITALSDGMPDIVDPANLSLKN